MTTKTDFHAIQELREKYTPKVRGIVSGEEAKTIYEVLEIDKRNNIELQNIRDMVVMIYGQWFDKSRDQYLEDKKKGVQAVDKSAEYLDAMSAITCVIDNEAVEIPECSRNWGRTFPVYPAGRTTGRYLWQAAYGYRSRRQAH